MNIIGIDCATEDKNMGVTCAKLADRAVEILDVRVGDRAGSVLEHLVKSCAAAEPTIFALDAPLGWPSALRLERLVILQCAPEILFSRADALDSVIWALAGADFLRGDAQPPDDPGLATKEEWIWSRLRSPASDS